MVIQWRGARFWCAVALFVMLASSSSAQTGANPDDLSSLLAQARQLYQAGKYAEALPLAQRAVELAEQQFGPEHPNVATTLNNLAAMYQAQGRYAEAEPLFVRSLAIREKALGPGHLVTVAAHVQRDGIGFRRARLCRSGWLKVKLAAAGFMECWTRITPP